jgi:hypothetical protein
LIGPKINGNPERTQRHELIPHGLEPVELLARDFDSIRDAVVSLGADDGWEGIVWHHADGRMAKLKARDFQ